MRKFNLTFLFCASLLVFSCGDDDGDSKVKCLECTSDDPDEQESVCEGQEDEDGNTVTIEDLEAAKAFLEAFGADCTLK